MNARKVSIGVLALAVAASVGGVVWGLGFGLSQTKAELKLQYDLTVKDYGNDRVGIDLAIADEGRLKPITAVALVIPNHATKDGSGAPDLSIDLMTRQVDGKRTAHVHILKEWAERAEIHFKTAGLDGKNELLSWYYYVIPIRDAMKARDVK